MANFPIRDKGGDIVYTSTEPRTPIKSSEERELQKKAKFNGFNNGSVLPSEEMTEIDAYSRRNDVISQEFRVIFEHPGPFFV